MKPILLAAILAGALLLAFGCASIEKGLMDELRPYLPSQQSANDELPPMPPDNSTIGVAGGAIPPAPPGSSGTGSDDLPPPPPPSG